MKGLYAGSFDPPTRGHAWMIKEGLAVCETLVVAVGTNPSKTPAFSLDQRVCMLQQLVADEFKSDAHRITVVDFAGQYLIDLQAQVGADVLLRGLRSGADFTAERTMARMNAHIRGTDPRTLFFIPPAKIAEISSSTVRSLVGYNGWQQVIARYLPDSVLGDVIAQYEA